MSEIERLDKLASVYKEAAAPAIAAGIAAAWPVIKAAGIYLMYAWMASGVTEHLTRANPAMAKLKEALTELVGLVSAADKSKMTDQDRAIIDKFISSAKAILPQIEKVQNIKQPSLEAIEDLEEFMNSARYVAYNAYNVANIMEKIETWYSGVGSFLVGMFGFGLEITDVRQAKARAAEVAATLGPLVSGLEVVIERTAKEAQRMAAAKQQQQAVPGDQVSEFATLRLG